MAIVILVIISSQSKESTYWWMGAVVLRILTRWNLRNFFTDAGMHNFCISISILHFFLSLLQSAFTFLMVSHYLAQMIHPTSNGS